MEYHQLQLVQKREIKKALLFYAFIKKIDKIILARYFTGTSLTQPAVVL